MWLASYFKQTATFWLAVQVSVGTGVKAGVNVWRALRDVKETHPAWEHLQGVPITEQDLVLPLRTVKGQDDLAVVAEAFAGQKAAAANGGTAAAAAAAATAGPSSCSSSKRSDSIHSEK